MFIQDGSSIDYDTKEAVLNRYSWGWIGDHIPNDQLGWESRRLKSQVIARLREIMQATYEYTSEYDGKKYTNETYCVIEHCGFHSCGVCAKTGRKMRKADRKLGWNGSILIQHEGKEFRSPWAVVHYIERHDYKPPDEAINALLNGRVRTYDEVDGEEHRIWKAEMEERKRKEKERLEEIERNKTPEQKQKDIETRKYLEWCAKKVKQLRASGAMVKL